MVLVDVLIELMMWLVSVVIDVFLVIVIIDSLILNVFLIVRLSFIFISEFMFMLSIDLLSVM